MSNRITFDEAVEWCLKYNIEIDPNGSKGSGTQLLYYHIDSQKGEIVEISKYEKRLQDAVFEMKKEIGETPEVGTFKKGTM